MSEAAVRYFLVGIVVILLRGIITEWITKYLAGKMKANSQ